MLQVIRKSWGKQFYEKNAALLFLVYFIMFGLVEANQLLQYHLALINGILNSIVLMSILFVVWSLYTLHAVYFLIKQLRKPEYHFLLELSKLPLKSRYSSILYGHALTQLPVYTYALFMIWVAIVAANWFGLIFILGSVAILLLVATSIIESILTKNHKLNLNRFTLIPTWNRPVPFIWFYLGWIRYQNAFAWLLSKLFSFTAIGLFLQISTEPDDSRQAALGLCLALTGYTVLIAELRSLEERYLSFINGLPISEAFKLIQLWCVYLILLLPEMLILALNDIPFIDLPGLFILGPTLLLYWHVRLQSPGWTMDIHIRRVILTYLINFILVLYGLYYLILLIAAFEIIRTNKKYALA